MPGAPNQRLDDRWDRRFGVDHVYHFRFVAGHLLAGNANLGPNHFRLIRSAVELLPVWDEDWLILIS
jgi:hypothetical protein